MLTLNKTNLKLNINVSKLEKIIPKECSKLTQQTLPKSDEVLEELIEAFEDELQGFGSTAMSDDEVEELQEIDEFNPKYSVFGSEAPKTNGNILGKRNRNELELA